MELVGDEMNKEIKIVIGANAGDEGKGLAVDYFASKKKNGVVIMSNGGSQRGHTVELPNKTRHVFHHFGSGTLRGWDTYFWKDFILNPMQFCKEYEEIKKIYNKDFKVYCDPTCMWSTPYDMIYNQIMMRLSGRYDTCGMGIWTTIQRYKYFMDNNIPISSIFDNHTRSELDTIRRYYITLFNQNVKDRESLNLVLDLCAFFLDNDLLDHFLADLMFMSNHMKLCSPSSMSCYKNIIIENGQGLLIDTDRDVQFGTPSHTGLNIPMKIVDSLPSNYDIEVCYVSRSYLTRHGYGVLHEEDSRSNIIKTETFDLTNKFNDFQGELRYGRLFQHDLINRILSDISLYPSKKFDKSVMITHLNENTMDILPIKNSFDRLYLSETRYSKDIYVMK